MIVGEPITPTVPASASAESPCSPIQSSQGRHAFLRAVGGGSWRIARTAGGCVIRAADILILKKGAIFLAFAGDFGGRSPVGTTVIEPNRMTWEPRSGQCGFHCLLPDVVAEDASIRVPAPKRRPSPLSDVVAFKVNRCVVSGLASGHEYQRVHRLKVGVFFKVVAAKDQRALCIPNFRKLSNLKTVCIATASRSRGARAR